MNFKSKLVGLVLGFSFLLPQTTSAIFAKETIAPSSLATQSSLLHIPVLFKDTVSTAQIDLTHPQETVEKYSSGTIVSYNLTGNVEVHVGDQHVYVDPTSLAISDEEKEKLLKQQEREAEDKNIREDAEAKIATDKKVAEQLTGDALTIDDLDGEEVELKVDTAYEWTGPVLTRSAGVNQGPSGRETYYNLPMQGVISIMRSIGNNDEYWVREDGVKMLGDYVMVAAHLPTRPRGSLVPTSLGMGIVCDTGTFALSDHTQLDIAVNW